MWPGKGPSEVEGKKVFLIEGEFQFSQNCQTFVSNTDPERPSDRWIYVTLKLHVLRLSRIAIFTAKAFLTLPCSNGFLIELFT